MTIDCITCMKSQKDIKLILLDGKKTLLRKKEEEDFKKILDIDIKEEEIKKETLDGIVFFRIPVFVIKEVTAGDKTYSLCFKSELITLRSQKLTKYSMISSKSFCNIRPGVDSYVLIHEFARLNKVIDSIQEPSLVNYTSKEKTISFVVTPLSCGRERVALGLPSRGTLVLEIEAGSNYKKEIKEYKILVSNQQQEVIDEKMFIFSELDRIQPGPHKFPYAYGSIVGVSSPDGDYADAFCILKDKKLKEGKRVLVKTSAGRGEEVLNTISDKNTSTYSAKSSTYVKIKDRILILEAILKTRDQAGEDPKYIFIEKGVDKEQVIDKINTCYKKWKKDKYVVEDIYTDSNYCHKYFVKTKRSSLINAENKRIL